MQADQTVLSLRPGGGGNRGSRVLGPRFETSSSDLPLLRPHGGGGAPPSSFLLKTGDYRFEGRERIRYTRDQLLQLREVGNIPAAIMKIKQEVEAEFFGEDQNWGRVESSPQIQPVNRYSEPDNRDWRGRLAVELEESGGGLSVPGDSLAAVSHLLIDLAVAEQETLSSPWMDSEEVVLPPPPSHVKGKSVVLQGREKGGVCSVGESEENSGGDSKEESGEGSEGPRDSEDGSGGGEEGQSPMVSETRQGRSVGRGHCAENLVGLAAGVGAPDQGGAGGWGAANLSIGEARGEDGEEDGEYMVTRLPCGSLRLSKEGGQDVVLGPELFDGVGEGKRSRLLGILQKRPTTFLNLGGMAVLPRTLVLRSLCSLLKVLEMTAPESANGEDLRAVKHGVERLKADGLQVGWLEEHIVRITARITLGRLRSELGDVRSAIREQRAAIKEQQAALALMEKKELRITGQIRELEVIVPGPLDLAGRGLGV